MAGAFRTNWEKWFYNIHHLFIYIVSSSTDESDILKAQQYGFVKGFLHKPITSEDINRIIIDWHYSTVATCFVV
jgi:hypothetical protein